MVDLDSIKEIVNQTAMQVEKAVMMTFRDAETGPWTRQNPKSVRDTKAEK